MTQAALARLWTFLASLCLLVSATTVSQLQGGILFGSVLDERRLIAAYYGIFVVGVTFVPMCVVARLYAMRSEDVGWAGRAPLFWMPEHEVGKLDRSRWDVKAYVAVTLIMFVAAPIYGIGHFERKVLNEGWIWSRSIDSDAAGQPVAALDAMPLIGAPTPENLKVLSAKSGDGRRQLRLRSCANLDQIKLTKDQCRGVDWYRHGSPLALIVFGLGSVLALLSLLSALLFKK